MLALSYGDPPRARGKSSSTSARIGCGWHPVHGDPGHLLPCPPGVMVSALSTYWSHMAHVDSSALTRLTISLRRWPLPLWEMVAMAAHSPPGRDIPQHPKGTCTYLHKWGTHTKSSLPSNIRDPMRTTLGYLNDREILPTRFAPVIVTRRHRHQTLH